MSGTLSPTGLKWNDPGDTTWSGDENDNITLLNSTLLRLDAMIDTNVAGKEDLDLLRYDNFNSEFTNEAAPWPAETVTTSSTSTSTTTTT